MTTDTLTDVVKTTIAKGFVGDREVLESAILKGHLPMVEYFHQQGVLLNSYDSLRRCFLDAACQGSEDMLEHLFAVYDIDDTLIFMATVQAIAKPTVVFHLSKKRSKRFNQGEHDILLYHAMIRGVPPVVVKFLLVQGAIPQKEGVEAILAKDDLDTLLTVYYAIPDDVISSIRNPVVGRRVSEFLLDMNGGYPRSVGDGSSTVLKKLVAYYL